MPEPEEGTEQQSTETPSAAPPVFDPNVFHARLDERLAQRDQALVNTMGEMLNRAMGAIAERMPQQQRQEQPHDPNAGLPTNEDFQNNPLSAMERFTQAKLGPLIQRASVPQGPDPYGMMALITTNKQELRERVGEENWAKYSKAFEFAIQKADPRELTNPTKMDAAFRLVRSYSDEAEANKTAQDGGVGTQQRIDRGRAASMMPAGARAVPQATSEDAIDDDVKKIYAEMGLAPETIKDYSQPREFEFGAATRRKSNA